MPYFELIFHSNDFSERMKVCVCVSVCGCLLKEVSFSLCLQIQKRKQNITFNKKLDLLGLYSFNKYMDIYAQRAISKRESRWGESNYRICSFPCKRYGTVTFW